MADSLITVVGEAASDGTGVYVVVEMEVTDGIEVDVAEEEGIKDGIEVDVTNEVRVGALVNIVGCVSR